MLMLDEEEAEMQRKEDDGNMMVEEFDFIGDNQNEEYVRVVNYSAGGHGFISP